LSSESLKRSFAPVVDARTRLLILGSLPGEISLARAQYYANPRNQFWPLMEAVIETELIPLDYEMRLATLLGRGIGLWDVVASATRTGSLDGAIRGHVANPLRRLVESLPNLAAIAFNGGKSAAIGRKELVDASCALIALPSSSPAYTLPFAAKRVAWLELRTYL
jgi:double-stranded uracil-DNA glycosylase